MELLRRDDGNRGLGEVATRHWGLRSKPEAVAKASASSVMPGSGVEGGMRRRRLRLQREEMGEADLADEDEVGDELASF